MEDIPWYAEASLRAPGRVFCAGSLAQCIRKWQRLPEIDQNSAYINLAKEFGGRCHLLLTRRRFPVPSTRGIP